MGRFVNGPRWHHPGTRAALIHLLDAAQTRALANAGRLAAVDLNPVLLGAQGVVAVDTWLMIGDDA